MGMISDFFVASTEQVKQCDWNEWPDSSFPRVDYKNVDQIKLATLENLLIGTDYEKAMDALMDDCVAGDEESGMSVHRLSDGLTRSLASLTKEAAKEPVSKWLATEEWEADGADPSDLDDFLAGC